jgi:hypothetical protein
MLLNLNFASHSLEHLASRSCFGKGRLHQARGRRATPNRGTGGLAAKAIYDGCSIP